MWLIHQIIVIIVASGGTLRSGMPKDYSELAKNFSRDIDCALCVENLLAKLAHNGDIEAFKNELEHLHEANVSVGSSYRQKHNASSN
jgi:hypothetical protein